MRHACRIWPLGSQHPDFGARPDGRVHQYAPPEQVDPQLDRMLGLYDGYRTDRVHVLEVGAWLHHSFIQIHPFADGNGRTGRLLLDWHLRSHGWLPALVHRQDRDRYLDAMQLGDTGDLSGLVAYLEVATNRSIQTILPDLPREERASYEIATRYLQQA